MNKSVQITHQQAPKPRAHPRPASGMAYENSLPATPNHCPTVSRDILLLLFAQPLTKIAALPTSAIAITDNDVRISLGHEPIPLPPPFADMLASYMDSRPHLRTAGGLATSPWLFPSVRPGRHLSTPRAQGKT